MRVSIIAAIGRNRELGKDNKLLWHISEDFKRFKTLTSGHPIIMGRKTWDSLPIKPLPNRMNIIVTRDKSFNPHSNLNHHKSSNCENCEGLGCAVVFSLDQALDQAIEAAKKEKALRLALRFHSRLTQGDDECFIIGGGQIYKEAIEKGLVDKLYLTIVDGYFDADTFFPDYSQFKTIVSEEKGESEGHRYTFLDLAK